MGGTGLSVQSIMSKIIDEDEFHARLAAMSVSKEAMNRLVMNYLVVEGHKEAAECFQAESGTKPGLDLATLEERRAMRRAIESGDVMRAIECAQKHLPELLTKNPELSFHLHQQQLIELIRANNTEEAISFAQQEVSHRAEQNASLLAELERTMMLMVHADPSESPESELLSQAHRQHTASLLNAAVLSAQKQEKEAALPMMLRRLQWVQVCAHKLAWHCANAALR